MTLPTAIPEEGDLFRETLPLATLKRLEIADDEDDEEDEDRE